VAAFSAVTATVAALSCCLPTGVLLASLGVAGASGFFRQAQPYLLAFAVAVLALGIGLALRARSCPPRRRRLNLLILGLSALLVLPVMVFPQQTAAFLADSVLRPRRAPEGQPPLAALDLAQLRQRFNDAASARRVIAMFSPT
jgi:hypothetical protein